MTKPLHARRLLLMWIRWHNRWGQRAIRWGRSRQYYANGLIEQAVRDYRNNGHGPVSDGGSET